MTKLHQDQWDEIKTRYNMGEPLRAVSRMYGITHGAIQNRAKKEGWTTEIASRIVDIRQKVTEISQLAKNEQLPMIKDVLVAEIDDTMQIMKTITNIHKGALNLHGTILKKAISQTNSGEIDIQKASKILSNSGLKIYQIHRTYAPEQGMQINNNTQINNDKKEAISISFNGK